MSMNKQGLQQLAREYAEQNPPADIKDEVLKRNLIGLNAEIFEKFLIWLTKTHCIVSREFVKRERLVIEFDKKQMLEKPIGEKIALAGVYQAKLELMDKLFGESTFEERSEK